MALAAAEEALSQRLAAVQSSRSAERVLGQEHALAGDPLAASALGADDFAGGEEDFVSQGSDQDDMLELEEP